MNETAGETAGETNAGTKPARLVSLDAYRGLVMCLLAINGLAVAATAKKLGFGPSVEADSLWAAIWQTLAFHNSHPAWNSQFYFVGCAFWDLIQPAFMFMVGVAMPYSYASRRSRGDSQHKLTWHALQRAVVLTLLGFFLSTRTSGWITNRPFTNVLAQIGLGYFFVFLLLRCSMRTQMIAGVVVLASYTIWVGTYPAPQPLPAESATSIETLMVPESVANHYAIHTNAPAQMDAKWMRWATGDQEFSTHPAGYTTLNFIPAAMTMLLGVLAGGILRRSWTNAEKLRRLGLLGLGCFVIALLMSVSVCPVIKRIWTPSWALYSGALVMWGLAAMFWIVDVRGWKAWTFPLVVVGMNSLAVYLMSMLLKRWVTSTMQVYLGKTLFTGDYGPMLGAASLLGFCWLVAWYFYRNRIFIRI